jgi:hypothetical protein
MLMGNRQEIRRYLVKCPTFLEFPSGKSQRYLAIGHYPFNPTFAMKNSESVGLLRARRELL